MALEENSPDRMQRLNFTSASFKISTLGILLLSIQATRACPNWDIEIEGRQPSRELNSFYYHQNVAHSPQQGAF